MSEARINLAQRTAQILSDRIKNDVYKRGDKLPNENELSAELGVSRTTLREAIRTLVADGVLQVYRGKGTFVSDQIDQYADLEPAGIGGNKEHSEMMWRRLSKVPNF